MSYQEFIAFLSYSVRYFIETHTCKQQSSSRLLSSSNYALNEFHFTKSIPLPLITDLFLTKKKKSPRRENLLVLANNF